MVLLLDEAFDFIAATDRLKNLQTTSLSYNLKHPRINSYCRKVRNFVFIAKMRMCQKTFKLIDIVFEEFIILWFVLLRNESDTCRNPNNVEKVILVKYKYNFLHIIWISLCRIHSLADFKR